MNPPSRKPLVAIACGGTGGHLFPGLAVAGELQRRGCDVAVLISPKEVDQQAVKTATGVTIHTLPAVGLQNKNYLPFFFSFGKSLFAAWKIFKRRHPDAVLAMGGFTSAPPVFAAKDSAAKTFLHESNTIPGKSNRFLSRFVDAAFIGFPEAAARLKTKNTIVTGTPVKLRVKARRLDAWLAEDGVADPLPQSPVSSDKPEETILLIPYAAAKLRITAFPLCAAKVEPNTVAKS